MAIASFEVVMPDGTTQTLVTESLTIAIFEMHDQGPQGPPGSSGAATFVQGEIPNGNINGINVTFDTAYNFVSISAYLNGLKLTLGLDFVAVDANTFQLLDAPLTGDSLLVDYIRS